MTDPDATQESDATLIERYRRGDTAALETLVEKHRRPLFGFVLGMGLGRSDADDVFQETWLRVLKNLEAYRQQNFGGWLMRIAHNLVIDRVRRRKPDASLDEEQGEGQSLVSALPGAGPSPSDAAQASDVGAAIARAVEALPPEQKAVFLMRSYADLSFKEIARIQRVSINTALARMQYALAKLRVVLKPHYQLLGR